MVSSEYLGVTFRASAVVIDPFSSKYSISLICRSFKGTWEPTRPLTLISKDN
ncbi:unnamed protein product, partial [marine sediment metagenome]